jgi:hypothetical protein
MVSLPDRPPGPARARGDDDARAKHPAARPSAFVCDVIVRDGCRGHGFVAEPGTVIAIAVSSKLSSKNEQRRLHDHGKRL